VTARQHRAHRISRFQPRLDPLARRAWLHRWDDAVQRSLHWHADGAV
jgi:glycerol kinase